MLKSGVGSDSSSDVVRIRYAAPSSRARIDMIAGLYPFTLLVSGEDDTGEGGRESSRDVEAPVGVGRVLGVTQHRLVEIVSDDGGRVRGDAHAHFELRAAAAVECGAVVDFLDDFRVGGEGGRGADEGGGERVQVGFHEPGEGLEVDKVDGVVEGGIVEDGLHAAAFLAMAGEGAGGVERGRGEREWERRRL